jgi:hypothetical protein
MSHHPRATVLLAAALTIVVAACSGGSPSSAPSGHASAAPSEAPTDAATIGHPTGPSDVILQYEEGGGFVMPAFTAASTPHFTLYGDGTLVVRDPAGEAPPPQGSAFIMPPLQSAKLTEDQIQELLAFALGEGGLAAARPEYQNQMIADASTAIFTIATDDVQKTVSVYALGFDDPANPGPDAPARAAFKRLADRLVGISGGGAISASAYAPEAYRVAIIESPGAVAPDVRAWPWEDVTLDDFKPAVDPNGLQFPHVTMTAEQVAALGVTDFEGGFQNLIMTGPGGGAMTYAVAVRPLLPGDQE